MKKCIFILEDDDDIREIIAYFLSESGYEVKTYARVVEFNDALPFELPDLFLLDIMLPDGTGLEVCRTIKANPSNSHIPVILMSAVSHSRATLNEVNAQHFINKPFDLTDLLKQIEFHLSA
ncbi:response regulator transcription factor [Olivibacter domesticus]|uniref:Response regulator receiver domain-containing protein n=1 Tax=Olivibacter domesticus TaxID=407022 RepID=A0A1H7KFD4_OLID1|nr:response regulator [Olivibacter domesticus]SEK85528.1 Response regulator receiver domain-containing protein [Olivibacter domesticus]